MRFRDARNAREDGVMPADPTDIGEIRENFVFSKVKWNSGKTPLRRIDSVVYLRGGVF